MCECEICVRTRNFNSRLENLSDEDREYFQTMYDHLMEVEHDRDYYKVVVDGTWPQADEIIKHIRARKTSKK